MEEANVVFITDSPLAISAEEWNAQQRHWRERRRLHRNIHNPKMTTARIRQELMRIHDGPTWDVKEEVLAGRRRADLVAVHVTGLMVAYEIKSNWVNLCHEMCHWDKSLPWRMKANQFYFVVPDWVFNRLTESRKQRFPTGAGVMLIKEDGSMKIQRSAVMARTKAVESSIAQPTCPTCP